MIITISLDIKKSVLICANLWTKKLSGKESRELAKQAVTTKCRGYIYAEPKAVSLKKPCPSVPKKSSSGIRIQQSAGRALDA